MRPSGDNVTWVASPLTGTATCVCGAARSSKRTTSAFRTGRLDHHAPAAISAIATSAAGQSVRDRADTTCGFGRVVVETRERVGAPRSVSASTNAAAVGQRSAGSFASAVSTASSTASETVSRNDEGGAGFSVSTFATTACAVLPVKGGSPTSIS